MKNYEKDNFDDGDFQPRTQHNFFQLFYSILMLYVPIFLCTYVAIFIKMQ